jgi:rhodanese-related sulfurtransferase
MPAMRVLAAVALAVAFGLPAAAADLEAGRRLYRQACMGCHGEDGDSLSYANVAQLAGIARRHPPEAIARMSGAFSGRIFHGQDQRNLVAYLGTLPGAKGFPEPGWLISADLLVKKTPLIRAFRVFDTRGREAYAAGHIPNAVSLAEPPCPALPGVAARWLGDAGVTPETVVVIYDESGGPAAAYAWRAIRQAGHTWVVVLDGGWNRWLKRGHFVSQTQPKFEAIDYPAPPESSLEARPTGSVCEVSWDWRAALDADGFLPYERLLPLVRSSGLQTGCAFPAKPTAEQAHLILTLELLGYRLGVHPPSPVLLLDEPR